MLGNIGDLFVKCMRQVVKGHSYQLLEVSDYYVMYSQTAQSFLSPKATNGYLIPLDGSVIMWKVCG